MVATIKKLQAKRAAQEIDGGFTLIELLIVIVVLGILAAVVVFSLGGVATSSALAACQSDGATYETALAAASAQSANVPDAGYVGVTGGETIDQALKSYIATAPGNSSHYTFAIEGGTLYVGSAANLATAPNATAPIKTPASGNTPAVLNSGWVAWNGSAACSATGIVS
ncbi:MAG: type II secretion system GspH family protein [Acidobacteria bacterium]|nr:type II secretion system GspH family protein [Acidobacteriota bacterium]